MNPRDLALINELKEKLDDIRSTLDEIVEKANDFLHGYGNVESAAYHIGDAIDELLRIEM